MAKKKKTSYEEWLKQNDSGVVRTADAVVTTMRGVQNAVQNATQRSRINKYNTPGFNPYQDYNTAVQYGKDLQSMYDSYKGQNLFANSLKAGQNPLDAYRQESRLKSAITRHNTYMDGIADEAAFNEQIAYPMRYQGLTSAAGVTARLKGMQQTISGLRRSGQTAKANALQAEYDWLSQRQYDYWRPEDFDAKVKELTGLADQARRNSVTHGNYEQTTTGLRRKQRSGTIYDTAIPTLAEKREQGDLDTEKQLRGQVSMLQAAKERNAYRDVMKDWSEQDFADMEELARLTDARSGARKASRAGAGRRSRGTHSMINGYNERISELEKKFLDKGYSEEEVDAIVAYFIRDSHAMQRQKDLQELQDWGSQNFWTGLTASVASVPLSLAGGYGYVDIALQNATAKTDPFTGDRQRVDQYSAGTIFSDASSAIRSAVGDKINSPVGNLVYQATMSFVDSFAAMQSGAWVGEAALGLSAATQATRDAYARGATDTQALVMGGMAGLAESLFEHISIENLRIMRTSNAAIRKTIGEHALDLVKQSITEASEEGATDIANLISDAIIMGDKSELDTMIRQYQASGMSESDATVQAWKDWGSQLLQDMAAGALSGGMGSVVNTGIGTFQRNAGYVSEGRKILDAGNASALKELGATLPDGSYGRGLAESVNAEGTSRKTARQLGAIASELNQNTLRQGVQSRLEQLGVTNASETATAVMRELNGQTTTKAQDQLLNSKAAQRVLTEFRSAVEGSTNYTNEWAYDALYENAERGRNLRTSDEAVKEVAEFAKDYGRHEEAVNKLFKLQSDMPVESFKTGFDAAYTMGKNGVDMEQAMNATATQRMSETQRALAWEIGRSAANTTTTNIEEGAEINGEEGSVSVLRGGERNDGARAEESTGKLAEGAEPAARNGQVLSRSAKDSGAADLKYEVNPVSTADFGIAGGTKNKSIYRVSENQKLTPAVQAAVDTAKANGRNIVLFGGGNLEVRDGDAIASVRGLYDPNTNTMYVRVDHEKYTAEQIAKHENGHGLIAEGRITVKDVQDYMKRTMDEEAVDQALADYADAYDGIKMTDEKLWHEIICDALGNMNIFEGIDVFSEQAERAEQRGEAIRNAAMEMQNGRAPPANVSEETQEILNSVGLQLDEGNDSASPSSFSRETWNESEYVQNREQAAQELSKALGISIAKAKKYISDVNGIAKMIADDRARLDYESSPGRSSFVGNTEYGGSIDFSTVCKKRRLYTGTIEAIQRAFPDRALTADELLKIRSYMAERGYEVNCGFCYVEGSRAKMGKYTKQFLDEYRQSGAEYVPTMAEMNTATGQEQIRREHPEVYDAYVKFMNRLAQRKPKLFQLATAYKGEILQKFKRGESVEEKNRNGGLRLQSFSDFEIIHLIDTMQVIMDMSRVGLAGQAYTKVPDFAWAFGRTGLKINLSLVAKGVDANGRLIYDDVEGMDHNEAKKLRDAYSKNVGTILVVFDDAQLKAAMADDFVDFIIPFHRSQWSKKDYAKMGLAPTTKDYTSKQNERYIKPVYGTKKDGSPKKLRAENFMPNTYWDFNKSGKENAEDYLRMCAEANKRPKFANLLVDNKDGSFSLQPDGSTDGYWKLLIDFKMYDNKGRGSEQMPVRPDFNMKQARRMLNEYTGGHQSFPVAQDVVDHFKEELGGKKQSFSRELNSFKSKQEIDAEISRLQDQIRDIQNAKWDADERAKKDPRVVAAQERALKAEDEKGRSGSLRERVEYKQTLKKVKEEMNVSIPEGDIYELAQDVKDLKEMRERFLDVTKITKAQYQKLIDHFGVTDDYDVAGFILQDGRMLDFSGRKQYGRAYSGGREVYHNEIGDVLNLQTDTSPRIDMVSNGNIRLVPEINGINLAVAPTAEQENAIRGFVEKNNGNVHVDIDNQAGRTLETLGYRTGTSASKIISDIRSYFKTGQAPEAQSDLLSFYTENSFSRDLSTLDSDYMAAVENGDMEKAQEIVDEAAKEWGAYSANSGSPIHFYHGTHGRFYVFEKARQGQNYGGDSRLGKGFYFAHTKTSAKEWARGGNRIVDAYLQMRRPLDLRNSTPDDIAKEINKKYQQKQNEYEDWFPISKEQYKENLDRLRTYDLEHPGSFIDSFKYDKSGKMTDGIREFLSSLGYDGIVSEDEVVVFESEQIKSADPVTYDDDGNIIPLSERFNPNDADIRFSRDLENLDELRRENDRLRKRLDAAKQQTKRTTEPTLREGDVRKAARGLLKEMDSTLTVDDVADDMKALGEYMMRGEGKNERAPSWEEVKRRASEIAERIVDNASALSEASDVELYKDLRNYLRTTKLTLAEADRADMQDGYAEFARRNFNRIKLGNDGLPVDSAYQELQEMYGKGMFPTDITHPADQLMHIEDVLNGLRPVYENPHSYHRQEAVAWAANAVIDSLLSEDVRQTAPTFADKAEARRAADVAKERGKADARVAAERERAEKRRTEYMKRSRAAMERLREQRDRKIEKLKQSFRESKVRDRERREESAAKAKYIKRVREKAMKLGDWLLKNSDKEHIPEPLKNGVAEFLASINPLSEKTLKGETAKKDARFIKRMEALQDLLKKKKQSQDGEDVETFGGYLDLPKGYMEMFDNYLKNAREILDGTDVDTSTPLAYMSSEQLRDLDFLVSTLMHSIRQMNTLTENGRFHTAIEAAHNTWDSLRGMVEYSLKRDSAKRFLQWDNTTPFYAFRRFGEGGRAVFEGLQEGWDRFAFNVSDVLNFSKKAYTDAEVKAWSKKVNAFTLENGSKIRMTTAQIMSLYELIKRDQALGHINGGGIRIADIEQGKDKVQQSEHYHFTMDDISKIVGTLTERQRNVADSLQKYMQEQGGKWGNEVSMKRFDYKAFGEEHYFPIATEGNRNTDDPEAKANDLYRLLNMSATKSLTPHANNALVVSDIFDVFADHMSDMAKYNALALPILDVLKWKNYREKVPAGDDSSNFTEYSTDREIRRAYGKGANSWLMAFLKDMNGAQESSGRGEGLARKMISNYKVAAVAANLRVALLQPTAYVRAAYVLNPKYLAASAAVSSVSLRRSAQECEKHSGIARWKGLGFYDTNISRGIREQIHDGGGVKDKIQEKSMIFAELGDKLTWGVIWNACKLEQKAKGLSGEKLTEATAKRFREVVYATQVVDSTMTRSHTMRGKSLYSSMATAFMAEPTLSYNMLLDAYMDYDADKRKTDRSTAWRKNSGKIAKALGVYCMSAAAAAIVESIADAWRDDDEYETYLQKFLEAMFGGEPTLKGILSGNLVNNLNIFAKLPLVKDLFSRLQGFGTERIDTAAFDDLVKAGEILYEMYQLSTGKLDKPTKVTYYGNMTTYGAIYQTLKALSRLTGLPVSNLSREATGLWNNTIGRFTPSKKITTYEPKEKAQIKKAVTEGWLSEKEATKLLIQKGIADDENDAYFMIRGWQTDSGKMQTLTDLLAAGDKKGFNKEAKNLLDHGVDEKEVTGAAKNKVKDLYLGHDSNGNPTGVARLSKSDAISMLQEYAGMSKDDASQAVMKWTCEVVNGFKYEDIKDQYLDGNITLERANEMRELYGGKPLDDDQLRDWKFEKEVGFSYNDIGDKLIDGEISERKAKQYWTEYGGMSQEDADDKVLKVTFRSEYPDLTYGDDELTLKRMNAYVSYGEAEDIPAQDYIGYMIHIDSLRADKDANGNSISGSKMKKVAEYIDSLPLDPDQKTAVFRSYFTDGEISKNGLKLITW